MQKRWTVFRFPGYWGEPKHFSWLLAARWYAWRKGFSYVMELQDNKLNLYYSYWNPLAKLSDGIPCAAQQNEVKREA